MVAGFPPVPAPGACFYRARSMAGLANLQCQLVHCRPRDPKNAFIWRMNAAEFEQTQGKTVSARGGLPIEISPVLKAGQHPKQFARAAPKRPCDLRSRARHALIRKIFEYVESLFDRWHRIGILAARVSYSDVSRGRHISAIVPHFLRLHPSPYAKQL